ncbi:response regulator transcription factor [Bacillus sp. 1P06AnD]|uniref:response regulator transcription factor n=1 Tax=Bacillus sp. 1P06AnD TaxID=3132208 RepID=UPI0039A0DADE
MKILIIEDDRLLSDTILQTVDRYYEVSQAYDGEEGLYLAEQDIFDAVILDLMLPNMDGYEILRMLRKKQVDTPVIILTAKDAIDDKVEGFKAGADDYLIKPFHREELLVRIEAIIRRAGKDYKTHILAFKNLHLDTKQKTAAINGSSLHLNGKQYELLEYLLHNKNMILTKEQIFNRVWGFDSETANTIVEVYASHLRKNLKEYKYDHYIKTFRGLGYMFTDHGENNETK